MNLKFDNIVQIFRKILGNNTIIILKYTNENYQKIISKSGHKIDLYPAMFSEIYFSNLTRAKNYSKEPNFKIGQIFWVKHGW